MSEAAYNAWRVYLELGAYAIASQPLACHRFEVVKAVLTADERRWLKRRVSAYERGGPLP